MSHMNKITYIATILIHKSDCHFPLFYNFNIIGLVGLRLHDLHVYRYALTQSTPSLLEKQNNA